MPFSDENRVKLFRRALLEVVEGWKLLASTASTRSMSGFCAAVAAACATRTSNLNISGFTLRILSMSAVLCGCSVLPIDMRYQVSGARYCSYSQHLDYCLFSGLSAIMRVQYSSCSRSNLGMYCKLLSAAMPYVPLLLLCCCWCCGWVRTAAAAATDRSSSNAWFYSCCCCCCYFLLLCRCCYRFHGRERPYLLHKRRWK